jgi:hypothetical protein
MCILYNLQLTTYNLQLTTYNLQLTTYKFKVFFLMFIIDEMISNYLKLSKDAKIIVLF